jgi:large subunit ribosomal protein L2
MLPSSKNNRWVERKPFREMYKYTVEPLPFPKTGGRGPNGRIWNHRRGGGLKKSFYMIDFNRLGGTTNVPEGDTLAEKIDKILEDPNRSARIALVASGEHKRYVIATESMKPGNVIKSTEIVTRSPIRPVEGDSHPLGSLPLGTLVCCVERFPGEGGMLARSAGVTAMLLRRRGDMCTLRLPSKQEIEVSSKCTATVGRVSNVDHNKRVIGKAGHNRWLGIRPRSGRWHRKTGRFGRKIHPPPPVVVYAKPPRPKPAEGRFVLPSVPGIYQSVRY